MLFARRGATGDNGVLSAVAARDAHAAPMLDVTRPSTRTQLRTHT
jgi:hypothetical protein